MLPPLHHYHECTQWSHMYQSLLQNVWVNRGNLCQCQELPNLQWICAPASLIFSLWLFIPNSKRYWYQTNELTVDWITSTWAFKHLHRLLFCSNKLLFLPSHTPASDFMFLALTWRPCCPQFLGTHSQLPSWNISLMTPNSICFPVNVWKVKALHDC